MAPSHIGNALSRLAVERANLPLTISNGRVKTGAEFVERIQSLAAGLRVNLGMQCGDRAAIVALNSDLYLEWLLAVPCAGGIIAPLNYRWSSHEACDALQQIDPILLVIDQHCATLGAEIKVKFPALQLVTLDHAVRGALDAESILLHSRKELQLCWAPDAIAIICFTSGTTGRPKGAAISHNAVIVQSLAKIAVVKYSFSDVYLHASPLCHIGGISSAHAMILAGGCHVFLPKFHALDAFDAIREHQVTALIAVPTMLKDLTSLLLSRSRKDYKLPSIEKILNGAGSLSLDLIQRIVRSFPAARILSAYGMTETCSSMTFSTLYNPTSREIDLHCLKKDSNASYRGGFCVGKPAPHVELTVSTNNGLKGAGKSCFLEEGEVLVRGPHMMEKYWGKVECTFDGDGWFCTGDIGWMDHIGQLWLLGRQKDVIKSGGENVHCYEVEEILSRHSAVESVAVVGVHDARLGEIVGAMILLRDEWRWKEEGRMEGMTGTGSRICINESMNERVVSANSLKVFCEQQGLSRYKIPKIWCQKFGAFAVTSTGKMRKDIVRNELAAHMRSQPISHEIEATMSKL